MPVVKKDVPIDRPVTFRKIYATNILLGMTEHDFRIEFFNEKINSDEDEDGDWIYISEGMTILTPLAAKRLKNALTRKIREFEKIYGTIKESKSIPIMYTKVEKQ